MTVAVTHRNTVPPADWGIQDPPFGAVSATLVFIRSGT